MEETEKKVLRQRGWYQNLPLFVAPECPSRDVYVPQDFGGIVIGAARPYCWMTPEAYERMLAEGAEEIGDKPWPDPPRPGPRGWLTRLRLALTLAWRRARRR